MFLLSPSVPLGKCADQSTELYDEACGNGRAQLKSWTVIVTAARHIKICCLRSLLNPEILNPEPSCMSSDRLQPNFNFA